VNHSTDSAGALTDGSPPPWAAATERARRPAKTAAATDKWSPQPEPLPAGSPSTEPATSARPSLDDGAASILFDTQRSSGATAISIMSVVQIAHLHRSVA
jgi:hypothetical protein